MSCDNPSTLKDYMVHEFIGLNVRVIKSAHVGYEELKGTIVNETMKIFEVEDKGVVRKIPKKGNMFELKLSTGEKARFSGDNVVFRPEDRIKKLWKKGVL